ncbi:MAG: hypothetical protein ACI3XQ_04860 [Eubacteriales bacterium]
MRFTLRKELASESEVSHSTRSKRAQERTGDSRSENARQSILPLAKWRVLPVGAAVSKPDEGAALNES